MRSSGWKSLVDKQHLLCNSKGQFLLDFCDSYVEVGTGHIADVCRGAAE